MFIFPFAITILNLERCLFIHFLLQPRFKFTAQEVTMIKLHPCPPVQFLRFFPLQEANIDRPVSRSCTASHIRLA